MLLAGALQVAGDHEAAHRMPDEIHFWVVAVDRGGVMAQQLRARDDLVDEGGKQRSGSFERLAPVVGEGKDRDRLILARAQIVTQLLDQLPVGDLEQLSCDDRRRLFRLEAEVVGVESRPLVFLGHHRPDRLRGQRVGVGEVGGGDPRNDDGRIGRHGHSLFSSAERARSESPSERSPGGRISRTKRNRRVRLGAMAPWRNSQVLFVMPAAVEGR